MKGDNEFGIRQKKIKALLLRLTDVAINDTYT